MLSKNSKPDDKASSEEIEEMVFEIIGDHFGKPAPSLANDTLIMDDCGADYYDQMELIMTVEELFGIKISDNIENIHCIRDIVNAIIRVSPSASDLDKARKSWQIATRRSFE
jgi:acyl carrier protein